MQPHTREPNASWVGLLFVSSVVCLASALPALASLQSGTAQQPAGTEETWTEHLLRGGVLMWPVGVAALAAALVGLLKGCSLAFVRRPASAHVGVLLEAVRAGDREAAIGRARAIGGPTGAMLEAGAKQLGEAREGVQAAMQERVLATRAQLFRWLPFVAIVAGSAFFLGVLGTVVDIVAIFARLLFGSGDPKPLSRSISEALITTEGALYLAIPPLLLHTVLSRRARRVVEAMEHAASALLGSLRKP